MNEPFAIHRKSQKERWGLAWLWLAMLVTVLSPGCVRRRMTIRTNPSGAMVYVDKQPIGLSPVSTSFTYYGTRNVEVIRDGYRTEKFLRRFNPPWYAIPPLDFFSETLWPFEQRDERILDVQLTPDPVIPMESLIASGEQLRLQASQGVAVAPPPTLNSIPPYPNQPGLPILGPVDPNQSLPPGTFPVYPQTGPQPPGWQPGDALRGFFAPGGQLPTSNPGTTVLPGGSYRPEQP